MGEAILGLCIGFLVGISLMGFIWSRTDTHIYPIEVVVGQTLCLKNDNLKWVARKSSTRASYYCNDGAVFIRGEK